jgi:uncharacterized protein
MNQGERARRLRIYISSTDRYEHTPLYEAIVYSARKQGLAGATVLKGIMGFGASSEVYTNKLWELTEKIPLVVEIIDEPEKVDSFFESLKPVIVMAGKGHLITLEDVTVMLHKPGNKNIG